MFNSEKNINCLYGIINNALPIDKLNSEQKGVFYEFVHSEIINMDKKYSNTTITKFEMNKMLLSNVKNGFVSILNGKEIKIDDMLISEVVKKPSAETLKEQCDREMKERGLELPKNTSQSVSVSVNSDIEIIFQRLDLYDKKLNDVINKVNRLMNPLYNHS